jgi:hypothetical protein
VTAHCRYDALITRPSLARPTGLALLIRRALDDGDVRHASAFARGLETEAADDVLQVVQGVAMSRFPGLLAGDRARSRLRED